MYLIIKFILTQKVLCIIIYKIFQCYKTEIFTHQCSEPETHKRESLSSSMKYIFSPSVAFRIPFVFNYSDA